MITDDDLVDMIRVAATEKLPIAVMSMKEMRHFAELVARDCIAIVLMPDMAKKDIVRLIRSRYAPPQH